MLTPHLRAGLISSIMRTLLAGIAMLSFPRPAMAQPELRGQWSSLMQVPLVAVHVAHLPTGKYLIFGRAPLGDVATLWDPKTNTFQTIESLGVDIFCAGHTFLSDGTLLINGGHILDNFGITDSLIFNPYTETWKRVGNMAYPRWYPTTTLLSNGKVLTHSGSMWEDAEGMPVYSQIPEVYDPETQNWTTLNSLQAFSELYPGLYQLPNGKVALAGKARTNVKWTDIDLLDSWEQFGSYSVIFMGGSSVSYRPGKLMKSGGTPRGIISEEMTPRAAVMDLNLPNPEWRDVAPMVAGRIDHCSVPLPDGKVLINGGSTYFNKLATAVLTPEMWDPDTETFSPMADLAIGRIYHSTSTLMADGRVWTAGGGKNGRDDVDNPDQLNGQIFSPPYLFKGPRPTITAMADVLRNDGTFTIRTPQAASIATVSLVKLGAVTHGLDMSTMYVPLTFTKQPGRLTVTAPTKFEAPPGYYMAHIVNDAGVPSVSKYVLVTQSLGTATPSQVISTEGESEDPSPWLLASSDDQRLTFQLLTENDPASYIAEIVVEAPAPAKHLSYIEATIEAAVSKSQYSMKIELYDFENDVWETVGTALRKKLGDQTHVQMTRGYVSRFVDRQNQVIRARLRFFGPALSFGGAASVDLMSFEFGK
ncbi:MAG: galactose oxidase early set domain-containing protein [Fimbriimonadaceae bacterium]